MVIGSKSSCLFFSVKMLKIFLTFALFNQDIQPSLQVIQPRSRCQLQFQPRYGGGDGNRFSNDKFTCFSTKMVCVTAANVLCGEGERFYQLQLLSVSRWSGDRVLICHSSSRQLRLFEISLLEGWGSGEHKKNVLQSGNSKKFPDSGSLTGFITDFAMNKEG